MNTVLVDGKFIKIGDTFEGWELMKVNSSSIGQHGEPIIKATFKKGNSTKNINDMVYQTGNTIRAALGVSKSSAAKTGMTKNEFKKLYPESAALLGWGGKRRKTHRRKSHKHSTHKRRH